MHKRLFNIRFLLYSMYLSVPFVDGGRVESGGRRVGLAVEEEEVGKLPEGVVVAEGVHLGAELGQGEQDLCGTEIEVG